MTPTTSDNPLLDEWDTPFGLPPFAKITDDHFAPAFKSAFAVHRDEIAGIAGSSDAPNFENTITALEKSGEALRKVSAVFYNLSGSHTNPAIQKIERDIAPVRAKHYNDMLLNRDLFARVDALTKDTSSLTAEQARVLERYHTMFVRAGAGLQGDARNRAAAIKQRLAELGTQFSQNVLADEADYVLHLTDEADLSGLPPHLKSAAARNAKERGYDGGFAITLSRSSIEPFLQFADRRDLREQAFSAWAARGEKDGASDNRKVAAEIVALRAELASLLGFANFASFKLDDQMAKTPAAVRSLLTQVWDQAVARAAEECAKLQETAQAGGGNFAIAPWDWRYYAEKVRKAEYDFDGSSVEPYLQLDKMIEAAFDTAHRLFGLTFRALPDVSLYHPDARAYEVLDRHGGHLGVFIGDYFARPSKRSGAWMSNFRDQHKLDGDGNEEVRPIIVNVANFAKGADGQPSLLTFDDARTLFHEFGHALHGLMSDVTYPMISGTSVARDFVELPSQLYEHWLSQPDVLRRFARHCETGAAMPEDLLEKLQAAENFNQGFATVEYVSSALVDLDLHELGTDEAKIDITDFERQSLSKIDMPDAIIMRHRTPHFSHVFAGDGYSAGYYSYMWSEVMDADAFEAFEETGDPFDSDTASRLAKHIYTAGGTQDPAEAYKAFRGRAPEVKALMKKRGFEAA